MSKNKNQLQFGIDTTRAGVARITGIAGLMAPTAINVYLQWFKMPSLRGVLPDVVDVFNHTGNAFMSARFSIAAASVVAGGLVLLNNREGRYEGNAERITKTALYVGTLAAAAVNIGIESVDAFTPDVMDVVIGIGAGALAAGLVKVEERPQ